MRLHKIPGAPDCFRRDDEGNLHLGIPELLRELNVVDTPENRDEATKIAGDIARELYPDINVVETA